MFGGTGFLGRRIVHHLRESGVTVRVASRHPGQTDGDDVKQIAANAHDERSVEAAIAGADGVVNAISLYVEHGRETFHSVHVEAATRIASVARRVGVKRLVHISEIGADAASPSPYIRSRGEGEAAVQTAFPGVVIIRPAVMFAPDDGFLTTILRLLRILPAYPIFGDGRTRLQPAYADDVAAGDYTSPTAEQKAISHLRTGWAARLFLRRAGADHCPYRGTAAGADADALCLLGRSCWPR